MSGVRQKLLVAVSFAQNRWLHRLHTRAAVERFQARHVKKHGAFLRQHSPVFFVIVRLSAVWKTWSSTH